MFTEENMVRRIRDILRPKVLLFSDLTFSFNHIKRYGVHVLVIIDLNNHSENIQWQC